MPSWPELNWTVKCVKCVRTRVSGCGCERKRESRWRVVSWLVVLFSNSTRHQPSVSSVLFFRSVPEQADVSAAQHLCRVAAHTSTVQRETDKPNNLPLPPNSTPPPPTHTITTYRRPRLSAFLSRLKSCRLRAKHNPQSPLSVSSK